MEISQAQWKEFQRFKEEYEENETKRNLLLQKQNDILAGGIRSANLLEYRNTYVINAQDSLDDTYPMYVHFNIIPEMTKIVSIQLSFWFLNFRAYAKSASSGGGATSGSGGGQTSSSVTTPSGGGATSGATGSASGGGDTSGSGGGQTSSSGGAQTSSSVTTPSGGGATSGGFSGFNNWSWALIASGYFKTATDETKTHGVFDSDTADNIIKHTHTTPNHTHPAHTHTVANHTHTVDNHTHTTPNHTHPNHTHSTPNHTHPAHTHTVADHAHTTPNHTHDLTFGIYEEETSPTIMPSISRDNGKTYSLPIGSYSNNQENLDITARINNAGSKIIKFTSNTRARLSVQITIKLDIRAR